MASATSPRERSPRARSMDFTPAWGHSSADRLRDARDAAQPRPVAPGEAEVAARVLNGDKNPAARVDAPARPRARP